MKKLIILLILCAVTLLTSCEKDERYGHPSHVITENSYTTRCKALTKKGTQCKRMTFNSCGYCWQHHY